MWTQIALSLQPSAPSTWDSWATDRPSVFGFIASSTNRPNAAGHTYPRSFKETLDWQHAVTTKRSARRPAAKSSILFAHQGSTFVPHTGQVTPAQFAPGWKNSISCLNENTTSCALGTSRENSASAVSAASSVGLNSGSRGTYCNQLSDMMNQSDRDCVRCQCCPFARPGYLVNGRFRQF